MSEPTDLLYWDSNVFLSYINGIPDRLTVIDSILEEVSNAEDRQIFTSTISKVEVAYAASERLSGNLDASVEEAIDAFWRDTSVVEVVEFHDGIAEIARELMRYSITEDWSLKPMDSIHLASAKWIGSGEFHTYDEKLFKYHPHVGFDIIEPYVLQQRLPNT